MGEPLSRNSLSDIRASEHEWAALRECVSPWRDEEGLPKLFCGVDWHRLLMLAEAHGVLGQLTACLKNDTHAITPQETRQLLWERVRAQNFLTLRLTAELFRLLELFRKQGIAPLVIKGPVLAGRAYVDPSVRSYGDLDLLVPQHEIRRATDLMIASGYEAAVSLNAIDAGKTPGQYLFSKPDSQLVVEFHNDLTLRYFPRPLPIEEFFRRQVRVRIDSGEVPAPCVEDELVLICVHGAKHFWERLSWIADVAALLAQQKDIDWERATSTARMVESEHLLHTGLRLAVDVQHAELPEKISARVLADKVAADLVARAVRWLPAAGYAPLNLLERVAFRLRMRGSFFAAPAYLLRLSFSPTEEDWQANERLSHSSFLDAVRRPFRLARKYGRNSKI